MSLVKLVNEKLETRKNFGARRLNRIYWNRPSETRGSFLPSSLLRSICIIRILKLKVDATMSFSFLSFHSCLAVGDYLLLKLLQNQYARRCFNPASQCVQKLRDSVSKVLVMVTSWPWPNPKSSHQLRAFRGVL